MRIEPFISKDGFEIRQFDSGEWDVRLVDCKTRPEILIWDWFTEPDIIIPLQKSSCVRSIFGKHCPLKLRTYYQPYSRQDRLFQLGGCNADEINLEVLSCYFQEVEVMALHSSTSGYDDRNDEFKFESEDVYIDGRRDTVYVFPDMNASLHFNIYDGENAIHYHKIRDDAGVRVYTSDHDVIKFKDKNFLICDDICDGGRTFVETAKDLRNQYGDGVVIELLVAHGFMTHGLYALRQSGISTIWIANPESYSYLLKRFCDPSYFIKFWQRYKL